MLEEIIRKEGNKWVLYTSDGKRKLGTFGTKAEALKRERQIQFFKHKGEAVDPEHGDPVVTAQDATIGWEELFESRSLDALRKAMGDHLKDAFETTGPVRTYAYIEELFDDMVIFTVDKEDVAPVMFRASYVVDDDNVITLGLAEQVEKVINYVPLTPAAEEAGIAYDELVEATELVEAGNIQALISSFGKWAGGSHKSCVGVLSGKPGITDPKRLCAWLKDKYTGTKTWRGKEGGVVPSGDLTPFTEAATYKALVQGFLKSANVLARHKNVPRAIRSKIEGLRSLLHKTYTNIDAEDGAAAPTAESGTDNGEFAFVEEGKLLPVE